jgi:hypothetical protein
MNQIAQASRVKRQRRQRTVRQHGASARPRPRSHWQAAEIGHERTGQLDHPLGREGAVIDGLRPRCDELLDELVSWKRLVWG